MLLENVDKIYGVQPVLLALRAGHRTLHELLIQNGVLGDVAFEEAEEVEANDTEGREAGDSGEVISRPVEAVKTLSSARSKQARRTSVTEEVFALARALGVDVREAPKHDLNLLADNKPHQGFVLTASKVDFETSLKCLPASTDKYR